MMGLVEAHEMLFKPNYFQKSWLRFGSLQTILYITGDSCDNVTHRLYVEWTKFCINFLAQYSLKRGPYPRGSRGM